LNAIFFSNFKRHQLFVLPRGSQYYLSSYLIRTGLIFILVILSLATRAQICPPNIDFEKGDFSGWTCWVGNTYESGGQNVISLTQSPPVPGRHTMYDASSIGALDPFGGFPVNCPNGSGHSIRLGNELPGTQAEGISYEFTIPSNQNEYSLIYHYAVVFQDPHHQIFQQPRMEIEITNVTDNQVIQCSSFTFIPFGSLLPGFYESPVVADSTPVWCKNWSAVSINLDGNAGKTIRLFFKTADCTFRRHFGYAYIDVNSECTSEFVGATYCPDDTAINVTAPYGYAGYTWFDNNFSNVIGNQQVIRFSPPPQVGTTIAVELVPYDGYGCKDTLYATLVDTLTVKSNAGADKISCGQSPVQIGGNAKPGLVYQWTPSTGLNDPTISNPLASPAVTTTYILTTRHDGGGCAVNDTVVVKASIIDTTISVLGKTSFCEGYGDSAVLRVSPTTTIQWYKDGAALPGATQTNYRVTKTGSYHAVLTNADACMARTSTKDILIEKPRPGIDYPVKYAVINLPLSLQARPFGISAVWSPPFNLDDPSTFTPVFKGNTEQLYNINITTASGCLTIDRQLVKIVPRVDIIVPTAFTPNNDGLNDLLRPILMGVKELHYFRVFNRWGQLLYETKTPTTGWDGKLNGVLQNSQVVVWVAEGVGVDNSVYTRKGTVVLIR
jgi:gliding motility-associated-like protein